MINSPTLITGIERSGSSLVARIINICGGFSGNTTGMLENKAIGIFVDKYYRFFGADIRGQFPLPDIENLYIPQEWQENITELFKKEGHTGQPVFYKSARIGQVWPIWSFAFPTAKWIIVRRRTGDIIQSCMKTAYMNAFEKEQTCKQVGADTPAKGWLWWVHEHEKRLMQLIQSGVQHRIIWPDRMVDGDYTQIQEMVEWLGLEWNNKVFKEIDPLIQKERKR